MKSESGFITLDKEMPQASLCDWVLDMRDNLSGNVDLSLFIEIKISNPVSDN